MAGDKNISTAFEGGAEGQYSRAKISVWWDIEKCEVPKGFDPRGIAESISSSLMKMNYCGPISISAYGDTTCTPHSLQQALNSTGISLNHVPAGVKDASDKKILVDMLFWAVDNPSPANYLLICGDRDFSNALHQLRMRRYNILLAQPLHASIALVAAAKSVWHWTSLLAGQYPVTSSKMSQLANVNNVVRPQTSQALLPDAFRKNQAASLYHENLFSSNQKSLIPAVIGDSTEKEKDIKNTNQPLITRTLSAPNDVQGSNNFNNSTQPDNAPAIQFRRAPHEFFGVGKSVIPAKSTPSLIPSNSDPWGNSGNLNTLKDKQSQYTRTRMFSNSCDRYGADNKPKSVESSNTDRPYGQQDDSISHASHSLSLPTLGNRNPANYGVPPVSSSSANTKFNNVSGRVQGCQPPSDYSQGFIGVILLALHYLKLEKLIPTEANIRDCIRYGDPKFRNIDVDKALNFALEHQMITKQYLGAVPLYVGRIEKLWNCVNPIGGNQDQYPKATWDAIQNFLTSASGRSAIAASNCRFEAGLILKNSCLRDLALGEVLQILNIITTVKKWVSITQPGWQPVIVTIEGSKSGSSTYAGL